jgi:hypothetical protein
LGSPSSPGSPASRTPRCVPHLCWTANWQLFGMQLVFGV